MMFQFLLLKVSIALWDPNLTEDIYIMLKNEYLSDKYDNKYLNFY
jgi:hypothetical protein